MCWTRCIFLRREARHSRTRHPSGLRGQGDHPPVARALTKRRQLLTTTVGCLFVLFSISDLDLGCDEGA
jgi:hypothetical protein